MSRYMSRLFGLALLLAMIGTPFFATGPSIGSVAAQDAATPCPALTEDDAAAMAAAWATAWNSHDAANVAALYAPDAIYHWGIGVDSTSRDEMQTAVAAFLTALPGIHVTVDRVWLAGDTMIIRYIAIGVQEADYMGVPASQTTVTWTGINVHQIECGLIVEGWAEADHFGRIEQQGVITVEPAPEATPAA